MLDLLFTVVFAGHLLLVDVAIAGPFFCIWLARRAIKYQDETASAIGQRLASRCIVAVLLGIIAGVALWQGLSWWPSQSRYLEIFRAISPGRWWGIISELTFYVLVMGIYYWTWNGWQRWKWAHALLAIVAATTLASHFPSLFSSVSAHSTRGTTPAEIEKNELFRTRHLFQDGETLARSLHHILAAVSVVGVIVACKAARRGCGLPGQACSPGEAEAKRIGILASRSALIASVLQMPVGVWVFTQLPSSSQNSLLGNDLLGAGVFLIALVFVLGLLHHLSSLAMGQLSCRKVYVCGGLLIATTVFMCGILHRARSNAFLQLDLLQKTPAQPVER